MMTHKSEYSFSKERRDDRDFKKHFIAFTPREILLGKFVLILLFVIAILLRNL